MSRILALLPLLLDSARGFGSTPTCLCMPIVYTIAYNYGDSIVVDDEGFIVDGYYPAITGDCVMDNPDYPPCACPNAKPHQ